MAMHGSCKPERTVQVCREAPFLIGIRKYIVFFVFQYLFIVMKKKHHYTVELISENVKKCNNIAELFRLLKFPLNGSLQFQVKKFIKENGIDISHFTGPAWNRGKTTLDDDRIFSSGDSDRIFVTNSEFSKPYVRSLVLKKNLIKYSCSVCKNTGEWLSKKLKLQLDHINGISTDQRIENLRWLCPNCHSQTSTYCGKNSNNTGKRKISDEQILVAFLKYKSIHQCLKRLGIDNGRNYSRVYKILEKFGHMMKLGNIIDSKPIGESFEGSSPSVATNLPV